MTTLIASIILILIVRHIYRRFKRKAAVKVAATPVTATEQPGRDHSHLLASFRGSRADCVKWCAELYNAYPPERYATRALSPPHRAFPLLPYTVTVERLRQPRPTTSTPKPRKHRTPPMHSS